jgi:hypothetical protein
LKYAIAAVVALLLGLVLGGLGPRAEVRALNDRIAELEKKDCKSGVGAGLASMFGNRPLMDDVATGRRQLELPDPPEEGPADEAEGAPAEEGLVLDFGDGPTKVDSPEQAKALAKEALEIRRAAARAALEEDAEPDEEQMQQFDEAVAEMNASLMALAEEVVARAESGDVPERRDMMVFAADSLDIMITAEDGIQASFTEEQLAAMEDGSVDPFSYVDPALVDVLGKLDGLVE